MTSSLILDQFGLDPVFLTCLDMLNSILGNLSKSLTRRHRIFIICKFED